MTLGYFQDVLLRFSPLVLGIYHNKVDKRREKRMNTQQAPIGSGFNRDTTAKEALGGADLTGKTVIVTGGASGIGLETTRVLSGAGAQVIVAVRSPERAR